MKTSKTLEELPPFERLVKVMEILRGPDGCPWDKEQTEETLTEFIIEEAWELVDSIKKGNNEETKSELGDFLLQVIFLSQIKREKGEFDIYDVLDKIVEKLMRRHPHVFGEKRLNSSKEVLEQWENLKRQDNGLLSNISDLMPSLLSAYKITEVVSRVGFDFESAHSSLSKIKEEIEELEMAMEKEDKKEIESEIGDLLFSIVNFSRLLGVNPEIALKRTNDKFKKRFNYIEKKLREKGKSLKDSNLEEMNSLWEESKNE
ncbi:MAG: nucleoside triphosphate pyrophosphohydrolase [Candidatus Aminicenantia bacterium]